MRRAAITAIACGLTAAGHAGLYQDVEIDNAGAVRRAIESGAATPDIRLTPSDTGEPGVPALAVAARAGSVQVVRLLVTLKADLDAKTPAGETALMLASFAPEDSGGGPGAAPKTHFEIVRILVEAGAPLENPGRFTAVSYAAHAGRVDILRYLLDRGASPNGGATSDEYLYPTPLAMAVMNGRADAARLLLERGANPRVRGPAGLDALGLARRANRRDMVPMLECATALAPGQSFTTACKDR
jgi:ankyrin repeat protein